MTQDETASEGETGFPAEPSMVKLATRGATGGILMGLANLVPGISGGTMLLAAGVYPNFVRAVAELTTLRFRKDSMVVLASVGGAALVSIGLLAGLIKDFVVGHRWVAYSIFIGLTLGGVPIVWNLIKKGSRDVWAGAAGGFAVMAAIALWQASGDAEVGASSAGFGLLFLAGIAGASAMILPGISGGYLLLVMGVYVAILAGIEDVINALRAGDVGAMMDPLMGVVLPVGLGVAIGVVAVSNLIKWLLAKYERPTLGVLLGLLVGAVIGLWPFQRGVAPKIGDVIKGRVLTAETIGDVAPKDFAIETFTPGAVELVGALALIVAGYFATKLVAKFGED